MQSSTPSHDRMNVAIRDDTTISNGCYRWLAKMESIFRGHKHITAAVADLAEEAGISESTLHRYRREATAAGYLDHQPATGRGNTSVWTLLKRARRTITDTIKVWGRKAKAAAKRVSLPDPPDLEPPTSDDTLSPGPSKEPRARQTSDGPSRHAHASSALTALLTPQTMPTDFRALVRSSAPPGALSRQSG